jgi:hypothetical protein
MLDRLLTFAKGLLAAAGRLVLRRRLRPADCPRPQAQPAPFSRRDEWLRATGPLTAANAALERIGVLQATAGRHIDAAEYALQLLMNELRAAMPIPADTAPLRTVLAQAAVPSTEKKALAA